MLRDISIIIPTHPQETQLDHLLKDLEPIKDHVEIIISSETSRATSMNTGAQRATRKFLWFLHADSKLTTENIESLERTLQNHSDKLLYFDLKFDTDGPWLMWVNAFGANWRSRIFGTPYGDQALCISKENFIKAGTYPEDVPYGEDLMFVWHARQSGIKLKSIPSALLTSARKYADYGWFKLTFLYQWRWIGMSIPEAFKRKPKS